MSENISLSGLARQMVVAGVLDEKTAQQAQAQAVRGKTPFVTYVVQNKLAKGRAIAELASDQFGVALLDLSALNKESLPKDLISEKLARQHRVLPLSKRGTKLYVAISDPANHQSIADIQFSTGLSIESILVEDDKLGEAIDKLYESGATGLEELGEVDLDGVDVESVTEDGKAEEGGEAADDAPVVRFVNKMLLDAIRGGSSDLHFEPYEKAYRVRLRTDGILHEVARPPIQLAPRISARLKVMAGLDISERRKPQDGRIKMKLSKETLKKTS